MTELARRKPLFVLHDGFLLPYLRFEGLISCFLEVYLRFKGLMPK